MKKDDKQNFGLREKTIERIGTNYLILAFDGKEIPIDVDNLRETLFTEYPQLIKLVNFEVLGEKPGIAPPSITAMRKMQLIDYEPASDSGHFRFYPKGFLMLKLLEEWAEEIAIDHFGAMQIETPILYDWKNPAIKSQGESFHERHYLVKAPYHPDKEFVLRFAGDFGLFCMVKDAQLSYRHLPLRVYEYSKSYRYERSGELVGLRRLRGFSMPDIHSFCADLNQSWEEYKQLYRYYSDLANGAKTEYAIIFRVVEEFYRKYKGHILELLNYSSKPAVIELLSEMKHYWAVKHEFQGLDSVGGACQVATVQLDVEDAERYGIKFINQQGRKQGCVICHSSIGALERWIYLVLENALKEKVPCFPMWLVPTQIRIVPVSEKLIDFSVKIAEELKRHRVRVDIDDRNETVNNRVRYAEEEWVPYILVIGQRESDSGKFAVRIRGKSGIESFEMGQLVEIIKSETKDKPFRFLSLPLFLSKWPVFVG